MSETQDPMTVGAADMRGMVNTVGIEEAARRIAEHWAPPFDMNANLRLQGMIRAAFEAGQLDGMTNYKEPVF